MTYSHYIVRPADLTGFDFTVLTEDTKKLIEAVQGRIVLTGPNKFKEPFINEHVIAFNGDRFAGLDAECFEVRAKIYGHAARDIITTSCRTDALPYDLLVRAVMLGLVYLFNAYGSGPSIRVLSDANSVDWSTALDLYLRVFPNRGGVIELAEDSISCLSPVKLTAQLEPEESTNFSRGTVDLINQLIGL